MPTDYYLDAFNSAHKAMQSCWAEGIYLPEVFPKFFKLNSQIILRLSRWVTSFINLASGLSKDEFPMQINKVELLIALHADIDKFLQHMPKVYETIFKCIPKEKQNCNNLTETLQKSLKDLQEIMQSQQKTTREALIKLITAESGTENVRQVADLPRLYRKTNRDVPTRCSGYVEQMIKPLKAFGEQNSKDLGEEVVEEVLSSIASKITTE